MALPQPQLRTLIMTVLLSDSDVDAFCSDYFPVAFRRFSNGMDRVQKITILLQFAEPERLTQLLQEWQEYNVGARPVNSSLAWKSVARATTRRRLLPWILGGSVTAAIASSVIWQFALRRSENDTGTANSGTASKVVKPSGPIQNARPTRALISVRLDSVPQGAKVTRWDRFAAEPVAETPFYRQITRPREAIELRLEKYGYEPETLRIPVGTDTMEINMTIEFKRRSM